MFFYSCLPLFALPSSVFLISHYFTSSSYVVNDNVR